MTETKKKATPAAGEEKRAAKKTPAKKPVRDAYDDFLDAAQSAEEAAVKKRSAARKNENGAEKKRPAASGEKTARAKKPADASSEKTVKPKKPAAKKTPEAQSARTSAKKTAAKKSAAGKHAPRDAYDDFLMEVERPAKKNSKKKKKQKQRGTAIALMTIIVCIAGLAGWQYTRYQTFLTMKAAVDRATFYEGTYVEDVDVSAMTLQQAVDYWAVNVEPNYSQRRVTLSNGAGFTAAELGYSSDYVTVLTNAWNAGRSGSLVERYEALSQRRNETVHYNVTRAAYSEEAVQSCVSAIAEQIDRPAENARIASFDAASQAFQFADEVVGSQLDTRQLETDMVNALNAGGGTVELVVRSIQPEVVKADIASQYGTICTAVTDASSSSSNRLANIKLAIELINGTCLKPGETFSFNEVVGERTSERGFKSAAAYSSGTVINEVGGGICQVSTTLFNAAVKADLEIVERSSHSMTVSYVDRGKDAAVDWGNKDLKFKNTSDDNVYISCYLDAKKRVQFAIFGKLLPNGEYITVEGKTTERIDFESELVPNASLPSGMTQVAQTGKKGYKAEAYKIRWSKDGNQISKELLCRSSYKSTKEIIEYGP